MWTVADIDQISSIFGFSVERKTRHGYRLRRGNRLSLIPGHAGYGTAVQIRYLRQMCRQLDLDVDVVLSELSSRPR